jgi:hypothetical protein
VLLSEEQTHLNDEAGRQAANGTAFLAFRGCVFELFFSMQHLLAQHWWPVSAPLVVQAKEPHPLTSLTILCYYLL